MKNYAKILILLLVLLMVLQSTVFSAFAVSPIDISTDTYQAGTGYTSASQVDYKKSGSYIYNWGARGEDATFLTTYAVSFYTGSYTYDVLSELSGATTESKVPSSSLYDALSTLMSSKHSYETSYNATRSLFQYTDCEMNGNKISSFYSGKLIGPSWDGGSTWNREHTWPNSKGDKSGNGENDIMMLRPSSVSENSSRGNTAYGESSGYYDPNKESGGTYDLRGDVARIVLYTYVRWECTNTGSYNPNGIFGTGGVIQSIDILLEWIEEDPVDTWELGRNDSVQSITGTRNVFVDYPEYAFILFGREVPDMTTPSGEAKENSCTWDSGEVTKEATCTTTGTITYTCTVAGCGKTKTETIAALGHTWDNGVITLEATCTATGTKTYTCTRSECNQTKTESIKAIGHAWDSGTITLEPTCTNAGSKTFTCVNDPSHTQTQSISALGHTWGDWITDTEATETSDGTKHRVCSECNATENGVIPSPEHQHSYTSAVTPPTCTEQGYTTHTCGCGDTYKDTYISKLGHNYSDGFCSVCGEADPTYDTNAKNNFIQTVDSLKNLKGENLYNGICDAIEIYNSLSSGDKKTVSDKFSELKSIVKDYNDDVSSLNSTSDNISGRLVGVIIIVGNLSLAFTCLFGKKFI